MHRANSGHRVDVGGGVRLAFEEHGTRSGPATVLLHAWGESRRSFDRLTPLLSPLHVVAVDQRGHGDASSPDDGYELESLGADVVALLDALDLSSVVLVGSSSGGYVAQQVAGRYPDRVAALALIGSPATLFGRPDFADQIDRLTDPVDPAWARAFLEAFPLFRDVPAWYLNDRIDDAAKISAEVWKRSLTGLTTSRPPAELGSISVPTLILWGEQDQLLTRESQEALAASIRGSKLVTYEGVGHLVLWEVPERVAQDLLAFVQGPPAGGHDASGRSRPTLRAPASTQGVD